MRGGRLPAAGAGDESAGSTGEPFNWIRGADELAFNRETFQVALRFSFGWTESDRPTILLNTFSCGAWAAGFRLGVSLENWCLVKNMGPDPDRVHKTMRLFGPDEGGVPATDGLTHECKTAIVQKLLTVNTDFRESYKDNPASADPIVEIVGFDSEHFAVNPQKVKNSYFL